MAEHGIYTGERLAVVVARTPHPIKLIELGKMRPTRTITANQALLMFRSGHFVGFGDDSRIKFLRQLNDPKSLPFRHCWRTDRASVLPIWIDPVPA